MSWKKGNESLAQSGMLLTLDAVDSDDEGQYTCIATNIVGSDEASSDIALEGMFCLSFYQLKQLFVNVLALFKCGST